MSCRSCGFENPSGMKFCGECGQRLGDGPRPVTPEPRAYTPKHLAEKILTSRAAVEGERKQVTVLFADVKGSMELASQVDAEEWHAILDRFFRVLTEDVHRFEGTVNQYTGDGIMALFGAPIAHEDHAQRACYAALHLRGELRRYADEVRLSHGLNFSVRIGLNSGEVVVGKIGDDLRMDYTAQGHTVGLAARMEQLAEPGRIYLTEHTAKLVQGYFQMRDLGPLAVKGIAAPIHVFDLEELGRFRTRLEVARAGGLTQFVGRRPEVGLLESARERTIEGQGQIVAVIGEPGVGKSRLCLEFVERSKQRRIPVWDAHCPAHGKAVPYLPILQLFRTYFGIGDRDAAPEARRKIAGALLLLDEGFREGLPLIFDFLGVRDSDLPLPRMAPEARQRQLVEITRRLIRIRGEQQPAVLFIDDLHWIDPESDAFLAGIVDAVAETRTMLLVNYRPEYRAPWTERSDTRRILLSPLGTEAVGELIDALLGKNGQLQQLRQMIAERSGGNPFFAEELVQSLAEAGSLQGERGSYRLVGTPELISLPSTIQSVLAARVDRAGEAEKSLLQAAAVIGREFQERILERVADVSRPELTATLEALCRAEFIVERALYPEVEYAFRHPLTQEVAYRSQLGGRRASLHGAVARAIAEVFPERADENAALLAHHWESAGEPVEAARSHRRAAEWIGVRDAGAAVRHWRRIRELLAEVPASEETLRLRLLACHQILAIGWRLFISMEEADRLFAEGREIAERLEDRVALVRLLEVHTTYRAFFGGEFDELLARTSEAMKIAEEIDDLDLRVALHARLAWVEILRADPSAGIEVAERGIALAAGDADLGQDEAGYRPLVSLHTFLGFFLMFSGRIRDGAAEIERAITLARELRDEDSLQFPLGQLSAYAFFSGDAAFAVSRVLEAVDITARIGNRWGLVMAYSCLGHTVLVAEEWERALSAFAEEERLMGAVEDAYGRCWLLQGRAEAYVGLGNTVDALELARSAVRLAREHRWRYPECKALLTLARALRQSGGRAAEGDIEEVFARLRALVAETGMVAFAPFIEVERAELKGLVGDAAGRRATLEEAQRRFAAIGARGNAERIAKELRDGAIA